MQTNYHIWGIISSLLFILTAYGLLAQLQKIYSRKALAKIGNLIGETPCSVISSNRTFGSYSAFFGTFSLECVYHTLTGIWLELVVLLLFFYFLHYGKFNVSVKISGQLFGYSLGLFFFFLPHS